MNDNEISLEENVDNDDKLNNKNITEISTSIQRDTSKTSYSGEMSRNFGTGENAKINLILYIISTTLVIFSSIAAAIIVSNIFGFKTDEIIQYIKDLWSVFTPIITLGLGYLFGATKRNEEKKSTPEEIN